MKNIIFILSFLIISLNSFSQNKTYKYGITAGTFIQQYNGNLGSSFFNFKATCFAGVNSTFGLYLNKSYDLNIGASASHFGYCQTEEDLKRIVSFYQRCPGCKDRFGMGELRSLMISGNIAIKYKFNNGLLISEKSKFSPYIFAGIGINHLSDNMNRNCVNEGIHLTINGGAGIKYDITDRLNIGYNLGFGRFITKKVYPTIPENTEIVGEPIVEEDIDLELRMNRRNDFYMQNTFTIGINF